MTVTAAINGASPAITPDCKVDLARIDLTGAGAQGPDGMRDFLVRLAGPDAGSGDCILPESKAPSTGAPAAEADAGAKPDSNEVLAKAFDKSITMAAATLVVSGISDSLRTLIRQQ